MLWRTLLLGFSLLILTTLNAFSEKNTTYHYTSFEDFMMGSVQYVGTHTYNSRLECVITGLLALDADHEMIDCTGTTTEAAVFITTAVQSFDDFNCGQITEGDFFEDSLAEVNGGILCIAHKLSAEGNIITVSAPASLSFEPTLLATAENTELLKEE